MLFKPEPDLGSEPNRPKTLAVSIAIHFLLIALLVLFPDFLKNDYKPVIRIAGQDYDLSQVRELTLALPTPMPRRAPTPAPPPTPPPDATPLAQPPIPEPRPQPPPPPPPPPPQQQQAQQLPNIVITPEDVIADGARPDATQKASRGNTEERARAGGMSNEPPKPEPGGPQSAPKPDQSKGNPPQVAQNNTDPNSLRPPNLLDRRDQIIGQQSAQRRRDMQNGGGGARTGVGHGLDEPNFSAEGDLTILSDTRGYDFGPYLNQVLNKVKANWYSQIPEIARLGAKGRVIIHFTITKTGLVEDLRIVSNSGLEPLDRAAQGSITASNPFQKLPAGFDGDMLRLQFAYYYNIRP